MELKKILQDFLKYIKKPNTFLYKFFWGFVFFIGSFCIVSGFGNVFMAEEGSPDYSITGYIAFVLGFICFYCFWRFKK